MACGGGRWPAARNDDAKTGCFRRVGQRLLFTLFALAVSGCAHKYVLPAPSNPAEPVPEDSFGPFVDQRVDHVSLADYLGARVARVTGNLVPVSSGRNGRVVGFNRADEGRPWGFGWAVRLTADGYFLTAAHILNRSPRPLYLVDWSSGRVTANPIRVVWDSWCGIESEELKVLVPADFAIIHVDLPSDAFVEWAWDWDLRAGAELVAPGGDEFWLVKLAAGRLLAVVPGAQGYGRTRTSGTLGSVIVWHDVRRGRGDSGAPIFLRGGQLVGMTVGEGKGSLPPPGTEATPEQDLKERVPVAMAVRPDPDSLAEIISKDRERNRADD